MVSGQPSWRLSSRDVEAFVTEQGGHLGPVTFDRRSRKVQPYSVAPWAEEDLTASQPPIIQALRGDFFCLPFGGNSRSFRGEKHPVHGETANAKWHFESLDRADGRSTLRLSLATTVRPGRVAKEITLVDGQSAVYSKHTVTGMSGPMNPGHHAMLKFPSAPGSGIIATSPFAYAQIFPGAFEEAENYGYSALKPGAEFKTLRAVPLANGGTTDLRQYPARRGYEDLVMLVSEMDVPFAWTAVTFPKQRYVWFALKNPRVLRETIFWISNGGRHYPPWSGRHTGIMGLEEVTSYFHYGLAESAKENPISSKGFPTCHTLDPKQPFVVPYIMGVTLIPENFGHVTVIKPSGVEGEIMLLSDSQKSLRAKIDTGFLAVP